MAASAHELLNITLNRLKTANDAWILAQFNAAIAQARRNSASPEEIEALEEAFEILKTPERRTDYLAAQEAAAPAVKDKPMPHGNVLYIANSQNEPALREHYARFVRENYKGDPEYDTFRPEFFSFPNLEAFKASPVYSEMPADVRNAILAEEFPCAVLVLSFKNQSDAAKFTADMRQKGLIHEESPTSTLGMGLTRGGQ